MDEVYRINVAKTEFREAYNSADVDRLLSVFSESGFTDMSEGQASTYGLASREALRDRAEALFSEYFVKLNVIIIKVVVLGTTAYDYGWHEFILRPKSGGETVRTRQRCFELWTKEPSGEWKISLQINNADVPEQLNGTASRWFLSEGAEGIVRS